MMQPKYERQRLLEEALVAAASALEDPIELISVEGRRIVVASRSEQVVLGFKYADGGAADGPAAPGGGSWEVRLETGPTARRRSWLRRVFG